MKRVLITGASGFLGGCLAKYLHSKGYQVTALSRRINPFLKELGIRCFSVDICQKDNLQEAMVEQDVVVHTAANTNLWGSKEDFYRTNFLGTKNLLDLSQDFGIRTLFILAAQAIF